MQSIEVGLDGDQRLVENCIRSYDPPFSLRILAECTQTVAKEKEVQVSDPVIKVASATDLNPGKNRKGV